ncbi:MAG: ATP-binding protein [Gemmatimonadota bacterium]
MVDSPGRKSLFVGLTLLLSVATLIGWATESPRLLNVFPTYPPLSPFVATLMLLAGLGLWLPDRLMRFFGLAVSVIGLAVLGAWIAKGSAGWLTAFYPFDRAFTASQLGGGVPSFLSVAVLALIGCAMWLFAPPSRGHRRLLFGGVVAAAVASIAWTVLVSFTVGVMETDISPRPMRVAVLSMAGALLLALVLLQRGWKLAEGERRFHLVRWWLLAAWAVALAYVLELLSAVVRRPDVIGVWPATLALLAVTGGTLAAVIGLSVERSRAARRLLEAKHAVLREQERRLARSAELLRAALDASLDAFFVLEAVRDATGVVRDFRFLDLNVRGADSISGSREQLLGELLCEQSPEFRSDGLFTQYVSVLESGTPLEAEFRLSGTPGLSSVRYVRQQIVRVADGVAVTSRDITSARQLEEQFRHAQKMEAVGRVASGVAHDFNNLLTVIRGFTDLMLLDPDLAASHRADMREIEGAVKRGAQLTSRLLAFARRQPVEPKPFAISDLVADVISLTRRAVPGDVGLELDQAARSPVVLADRLLVEQALMNIILNARDAMTEGGTLTVRTDQVELAVPRVYDQATVAAGDWARITIADTGTGMSPQVLEHLFEPFFTTKPPGKGTGLGLSTAFGIVRQAGGHIVVAETGPGGTTVNLYLPAIEPQVPDPEAVNTAPPTATRSERILVVDDDPAVREVVRRLLVRSGYDVSAVESATAAEALLRSAPPFELLVTDMVMPGIGGAELARRACEAFPALRVLFISGFTEDTAVRHVRLENGKAFLAKPFTSEEMRTQVRQLLDTAAEPDAVQH